MQGKKDGCKEWPIEGESLFSYRGEPLPYMPFCYKHPDYWHVVDKETKRTGDMLNSRKLFDHSSQQKNIQKNAAGHGRKYPEYAGKSHTGYFGNLVCDKAAIP